MRKKRPLRLIVISSLSLAALVYLVFNLPPTYGFTIYDLRFTILPIVLILVFLFIFSLFAFILNNKRRGFLISCFAFGYFILRLMNLAHPFFIILLLILLAMVELLFAKRK